jgi:hypothetical protein
MVAGTATTTSRLDLWTASVLPAVSQRVVVGSSATMSDDLPPQRFDPGILICGRPV